MTHRVLIATALTLAASAPIGAWARPGDLDRGFGIGGVATTSAKGGGGDIEALVMQAGGRIVAIGSSDHFTQPFFIDPQVQLVRYLSNGRVDSGFGTFGSVSLQSGLGAVTSDGGLGGAGLADGSIVFAGFAGSHSTQTFVRHFFAVGKLGPAGKPDPAFVGGGFTSLSFPAGGTGGSASGVRPLDDGRLLAWGSAFDSSRGAGFALARMSAEGAPDAAFGDHGQAYAAFRDQELGGATDLALHSDGSFRVAGVIEDFAPTDGPVSSVGLTDFTADGAMTGALDQLDFPGILSTVRFEPDGKLLALGAVPRSNDQAGNRRWALMRYLPSGDPDPSFGTDGFVETDLTSGADVAADVAFDSQGRIVVIGCAGCDSPGSRFAIARYASDGTLDTTFGDGGVVLTAIGGRAEAHAIIIQPNDGKIIVGGTAVFGNDSRFALARYLPADASSSGGRTFLPVGPGTSVPPVFRR